MKRFAALGLLFTSAVVATAEPVSVHPPTPTSAPAPSSGSSLNQSLPAAIQSALPATAPPPVLTSTPSWTDQFVPSSSHSIPTVAPSYLAPAPATAPPTTPMVAPAACAPTPACGPACYGPTQIRPHLNLLQRPGWLNGTSACAPTGGCDTVKPGRERLKAWLHFQPTPSGVPLWCPAPYQAPVRAYFPARPTDCAWNLGCAVGGGCGQAGCGTCARSGGGRLAGLLKRPTCDVTIPTTPLPSAGDCGTGGSRPRVVYVPLTPRAEGPCADAGANCGGKVCRPSLLGRMKSLVTGAGFGCGNAGCSACSGAGTSFGGGYGCPVPPPSPVHYANPCSTTGGTVRYAAPCTTPPAQQPGVNYANPTMTPPPAVPAPVPVPGGKGVSAITPKPPTTGDATQAFTNP